MNLIKKCYDNQLENHHKIKKCYKNQWKNAMKSPNAIKTNGLELWGRVLEDILGSGKSRHTGNCQLAAGLGKSREVQASKREREILTHRLLAAELGKSRQVRGNGKS